METFGYRNRRPTAYSTESLVSCPRPGPWRRAWLAACLLLIPVAAYATDTSSYTDKVFGPQTYRVEADGTGTASERLAFFEPPSACLLGARNGSGGLPGRGGPCRDGLQLRPPHPLDLEYAHYLRRALLKCLLWGPDAAPPATLPDTVDQACPRVSRARVELNGETVFGARQINRFSSRATRPVQLDPGGAPAGEYRRRLGPDHGAGALPSRPPRRLSGRAGGG